MLPFAVWTGLWLLGLLVAERREHRIGMAVSKMLASTGFVLAAIIPGRLGDDYTLAVVAALCLSWLGDLFLLSRSSPWFRLGLGAFLLAHVAYAAGFVVRGFAPSWAGLALVLLVAPALVVDRWLKPGLPRDMVAPVRAYILAIAVMVALAIGTFGIDPVVAIPLGAAAFFVSDLSVARDRFVSRALANRLWGLPLYYAAQLLLASSVALP